MKKYLLIALFVVLAMAVAACVFQTCSLKKYKELCGRQLQNIEAYQEENAGLEGEIRQYQMTLDELHASNDAKDQKIKETLEALKIKEKNITDLQFQASQAKKVDTIKFTDTLFVDKYLDVDTVIGDEWYNLRLQLKYPSTIITSPEFTSEQYVIIHREKKFNKKPSKCFFIRWFQKKHWVIEVTVEEKNPYIDIKEQKYIKIDK